MDLAPHCDNTAPTPDRPTAFNPIDGCNCSKSNCLKMYCECFKAGKRCGDQCKCTNCLNTRALSPIRDDEEVAPLPADVYKMIDFNDMATVRSTLPGGGCLPHEMGLTPSGWSFFADSVSIRRVPTGQIEVM